MIPTARRLFALKINTVAALQHRFHRRLSEWHMAVVMLSTGIMLLDASTFDRPPFELVKQIADQQTWAITMAAVGGARLAVLIVNGSLHRGSPHLRAFLAFVSALIWSGMLAGLWSFGTALLVGPFLAAAVLVEWVALYRAAQDAREEDDRRGGGNGNPG